MIRKTTVATFMWLLFAMWATTGAHHSTVAYTTTTTILKNATVRKLAWANPHCFLTFDVKDARGRVMTWSIESGSPSALSRVGWNRNALKAGDVISVELFPAKNGSPVGRLAKVTFADGRELLDSLYKASPFDTVQQK